MSLWNHLLCKPHMAFLHRKCRDIAKPYIGSNIQRFEVPEEKVKWSQEFTAYCPPDYTDPSIQGKPWADGPIDDPRQFNFNNIDGKIDRRSFVSNYAFDSFNRPLNPMGRTGLQGRGILGRWGPNHAADPIVSRFQDGQLQFIVIQRKDTGEWAIPGGMVDAGEEISQTLKREFSEEALSGIDPEQISEIWRSGTLLFRGYVDDHRNTDNAWMETVVMNFHDVNGILDNFSFCAGDDAVSVQWMNANDSGKLYASHNYFIDLLKEIHACKD